MTTIVYDRKTGMVATDIRYVTPNSVEDDPESCKINVLHQGNPIITDAGLALFGAGVGFSPFIELFVDFIKEQGNVCRSEMDDIQRNFNEFCTRCVGDSVNGNQEVFVGKRFEYYLFTAEHRVICFDVSLFDDKIADQEISDFGCCMAMYEIEPMEDNGYLVFGSGTHLGNLVNVLLRNTGYFSPSIAIQLISIFDNHTSPDSHYTLMHHDGTHNVHFCPGIALKNINTVETLTAAFKQVLLTGGKSHEPAQH